MSASVAIASLAALAALGALHRKGSQARAQARPTLAGAEPQDAVSARAAMMRLMRRLKPSPRELAYEHLSLFPGLLPRFYRHWLRSPELRGGYGLARGVPSSLPPDLSLARRLAGIEEDVPWEDIEDFVRSSGDDVIRSFNEFALHNASEEETPPSTVFSGPRLLKDVWLIHHTDASSIDDTGFRLGVQSQEGLSYTGGGHTFAGQRPGYNFAYLPSDHERYGFSRGQPRYGSNIYALWVPYAIHAYHVNDQEPQVIFWGPSARNIVKISKADVSVEGGDIEERWIVHYLENRDGRTISAETSEDLVDWLRANWDQYRFMSGAADRARRRVERGWSAEVVGKRSVKDYYGDEREIDVQSNVFRGPGKGSPMPARSGR